MIFTAHSQEYKFELIEGEKHDYSVIAIPDFSSNSQTNVSDIGFTIMITAGLAEIENKTTFYGKPWQVSKTSGLTQLQMGLSNGQNDAFLFWLPPGQTLVSHQANEPIVLVSFDLKLFKKVKTHIELLENNSSLAVNISGTMDSFYNANIDDTRTSDYFATINSFKSATTSAKLNQDQEKNIPITFSIYPNPVSKELVIKPAKDVAYTSLKVMNMLGRVVIEKSINKKNNVSIDVSKLSQGMYLISLENNGKQINVKKFVKK